MKNHSKLLGATLIVAGTAIGGGMLALPLATAAIGFIPALLLMTASWALSAYSALLIMEVNLKVGSNVNYHTMAGRVLGRKGQLLVMLSVLALLYALTAAYLSGGGSLLSVKLETWLTLPQGVPPLLFALLLGSFAAFGVKYVDKLTKGLFAMMMLALLVVLTGLLPQLEISNVISSGATTSHTWLGVMPVLITSFGFHAGVPTLVRYLEGDARQLRFALVVGSALPLLCYALWLLAALGSLSLAERALLAQGDALPELIRILSDKAQWGGISHALKLFADLALVTSFLGVSLSLFDYLSELCHTGNSSRGRVITWVLTFMPPLGLALFFPGGFVAVLGYAAVPLVMLMVILPSLMARKLRQQQSGYQVAGGGIGLGMAAMAGMAVIVTQLYVA